ncbi:MAG TPA: FeoB-associated Cys-rich membrane protein [Gemmatirosa sp.]
MLQTLIIVLVVAVAFGFMARRAIRTLRPAVKAGCGDGCGCGTAASGASGDWAKS